MPYIKSEESQYEMAVHYRIRLLSKGSVEVFQYVFSHQIHVRNGRLIGIEIVHGPDSPGIATRSTRPLDEVYDIQIRDEPQEQYTNWTGKSESQIKFF